ncbi:MAG: hypothetical protein MZW92_52255 [Comamonadaceae bacterium]|nr:hypothetical protein [Comamonadaceae bacterium]
MMKTRMQPIGRLFQKYPRIARDLGAATGQGRRTAAGRRGDRDRQDDDRGSSRSDHPPRSAMPSTMASRCPHERIAAGKPAKAIVRLEARQEGDHIVIDRSPTTASGMNAERHPRRRRSRRA